MTLKIRKSDFFDALKLFPELEKAYVDEFYRVYNKKIDGQTKLKLVIKNNKFIPSKMMIWVSYISDYFEIKYTPSFLAKYMFIEMLKKKSIY